MSQPRLAQLTRALLDSSTLCAISTSSPTGRPHVSTAYFAWTDELDVVWLSDPAARHSRNLAVNRAAAVAVYDSTQSWGSPDRGIQLVGAARATAARDRDAEAAYAGRFPAYDRDAFAGYRLYRFRPRTVKLFDERALGSGVFVAARRRAGGVLEWQRTEAVVGTVRRGSRGRARAGSA